MLERRLMMSDEVSTTPENANTPYREADDAIADTSGIPWNFGDLNGYIREGEPGRAERADNWQTAIGLQAVDGLTPSPYLLGIRAL